MARDPLVMLARLRDLDVRAAQRSLAEARAALSREQDAAATAETVLRAEQPGTATYGAFLARGLAARQTQAAAVARAEASVEAERDALAFARGAEKVIGILRDRRAALLRRDAARREQVRLEEATPRG